jgi:hypothetical protein
LAALNGFNALPPCGVQAQRDFFYFFVAGKYRI